MLKIRKFLIGLSFLYAAAVNAQVAAAANTTVNFINAYNSYGNGDFHFRTTVLPAGCPGGFWLNKTDSGYNANLILITLSLQNDKPLTVYGSTDNLWSGSGTATCKLYTIMM